RCSASTSFSRADWSGRRSVSRSRSTSPSARWCPISAWPRPSTCARFSAPFLPKNRQSNPSASFVRHCAHARPAPGTRRLIAPLPGHPDARLDFAPHRQHPPQQVALPAHLSPRREALFAQVPLLAVDLPRHHVLGRLLHPPERALERRRRLLHEGAERRRVDL